MFISPPFVVKSRFDTPAFMSRMCHGMLSKTHTEGKMNKIVIGIEIISAMLILSLTAAAQPRVALVIGNAAYETSPLTNPAKDAKDMATELTRLGFRVIIITDADRRQMIQAIQKFGKGLHDGSVALFYYSGHGMQYHGNNYLIPLKTAIAGEADIEFETVDANRVLAQMATANSNGVNLVILDACRDNPYKGFLKSLQVGLAQMNAPTGSLIVYATAPDTPALDDPEGQNSIYTRRLLEALRAMPDANIYELLLWVRQQVMADTEKRQVPWESNSLTGLFYFANAAPTPAPQIVYVEVTPTPAPAQPTPRPSQERNAELPTEEGNTHPSPSHEGNTELPSSEGAGVGSCWESATPGATCAEPTTGMEFVYVPGGEFEMGCGKKEQGCDNDEKPRHNVKVNGFWIGKYEVTQAQWETVMGDNPSNFKGANRPVESVSWNGAQMFLEKLNAAVETRGRASLHFRLPSEAEWEYAARAGTTTPFFFGETISADQANYDGNYTYGKGKKGVYRERTTDVGSFPPNDFGLYDMHGNVWEWVADTYHENYTGAPNDGSVWGSLGDGKAKVLRGGSWYDYPNLCRSASRYRSFPDGRYDNIGARVVVGAR